MNSDSKPFTLEGISFHDTIPLHWERIAVLPGEGEMHRLNRSNQHLLQMLLLSDDITQDAEAEAEKQLHEPLRRIESKLDLLLSLVTDMLSTQQRLPPEQEILMGTGQLGVRHAGSSPLTDGPKPRDLLKIKLYLERQFPQALILFGHCSAAGPDSFTLDYHPLEDSVQDLLDKLVFSRHRRAIAMAKKSKNT